jgi:hypothetical protein
MSPAPRVSLPDDFVRGQSCAICGADGLQVMHVPGVPDFVQCASCRSAYVADADSPLVMYGSIPEAYPHTRARVLRQWATLDAVEEASGDDRPSRPTPPPAAPPRRMVPLSPDADLSPADIPFSAGVPIPNEPEVPRRFAEPVALSGESPAAPASRAWYEPEEPPPSDQEEDWPLPSVDATPSAEDSLRSLLRGGPMEDLYQLSPLAAEDESSDEEEAEESGLEGVPPLMASRLAQAAARAQPTSEPTSVAGAQPTSAPPAPDWVRPVFSGPAAETPTPPAPVAASASVLNEPPPGVRYRAVLRGENVTFPHDSCAHCSATPARQRLTVISSLPDGQAVGKRKRVTYHLPLCRACHRRAAANSDEESSARIQAHLVSALFALVLLVVTLATRLISLATGAAVAGFLIVIVLILGYTLPALILLGRTTRHAPPPDAAFVRSTLFIPEDAQGLETAFEWRNGEYAHAFAEANHETLIGSVARIKDRTLSG